MKKYALCRPRLDNAVTIHDWIILQREGAFLMRLEGRDEHWEIAEQAVALDASQMLVLDCTEVKAMRLVPGIFDGCAGEGFQFSRVVEVRQVIIQRKGKKQRKRPKMSSEKQRAVREKTRRGPSEVKANIHRKNRKVVLSESEED